MNYKTRVDQGNTCIDNETTIYVIAFLRVTDEYMSCYSLMRR